MIMNNSTLLLVDDESMNLRLYKEMLKSNEFEVVTAVDGKDCLEKASNCHPDIIVMDWNMPVMDGMEALKHLKSNSDTSDIPVLMITGVMNSSENLSSAMEAGAIDFLRKPFDKLELNARVRNILLLSNTVKSLKEKNRSIENSNVFITSLIASIPNPMVYYSLDGIILKSNELFEELMGLKIEDLAGKSIYRLFDVEVPGFHIQKDFELIQHRNICSYERTVVSKNKIFIFTKNVMIEDQNNPVGIVLILTDITELRKANENLLELKKRELVSSALQLMHVSDMNNNMVNELGLIIPQLNKEGQVLVRQTTNKYRLNMTEQIWSEFEKRFESVFDSFHQVLLERFPGLTPNERKLAALLRLDLSSKDIAALTFQNYQSVDVARYRLRKKLNLQPEDNLIDFLLKIDKQ